MYFKNVYLLEEHISISEGLLLGKGRLAFEQYIPNKRFCFGINVFCLCDDSCYLWISFLYSEKNENLTAEDKRFERNLGNSGAVIMWLMKDLFGQGHKLYADKWYTSKTLFHYLKENGATACASANCLSLPDTTK